MAEIKIEKERTVWPWVVLGILLLGLLLYFLVFRNGDKTDDTAGAVENTSSQAALPENSGAVADYVSYVNGTQAMGLDHEYSNGALIRLANAVQSKAGQVGYTVQADLDQVRELADQITKDPMATTHANSIRRAAGILATAMQNMQQAKFTNLSNEVQEVKEAAQAIDPDVLTLEQKEAVKSFFDKSAGLLQRMD